MKKKILLALLTITLIVGAFNAFAIVASAETDTPEMSIAYCNLSFRDNICIKYAVNANVSNVKILIWTSPEAEYTIGTHDDEITQYYTEDINGVSHMIFDYTELKAKQMTDVVYARAYANIDGADYYSGVNKYSILQYTYNKLGKTAIASTDTEFKEMLSNMLVYGASAQKYFDYKEDRLATAEWYQVKLTAGVLDDGCTHGLYRPGDKVTLIALKTDAKGHEFSRWIDINGNEIETLATYELTVGTVNEIYTPVYDHAVTIDAAIAPSCKDIGLTEGSHCSICGEIILAQEIVAATGEHNFGEWETVKEATTTEDGLMERVCGCGEKETQTIEKIIPELAYTLNDDGQSYSVTGIGTWTDSEVVIPDTYNGLPVTEIGKKAFYSCKMLTSITISNNVSKIGEWALYSCSGLTSVTIPDSVTSIGNYAFYYCDAMISVTMGNSVKSIGDDAFGACKVLASITIPNSVTSIGEEAFYSCYKLKSITFAENNKLSSIGENAFENCSSLENVNVTDIEAWLNIAFGSGYAAHPNYYGTLRFLDTNGNETTNIVIPDSVTDIGPYAFHNCTNLTTINIPDNVTSIAFEAFSNCTSLQTVNIGNNVSGIGDLAFYNCNKLTSVIIPGSVTRIGRHVFLQCSNLKSIRFIDITTWYIDPYYNYSNGTKVTVSNSYTNATYFTSTYTSYLWYKL